MNKLTKYFATVIIIVIAVVSFKIFADQPVWGFYGHKKINRMAVFALPADMMPLYKKNIEYITDHAVDPDTRRYASKYEAIRHYIDIDHWDTIPFAKVPRDFRAAILKYGELIYVDPTLKDSTIIERATNEDGKVTLIIEGREWFTTDEKTFFKFFTNNIYNQYYEDEWKVEGFEFDEYFGTSIFENSTSHLLFDDHFSKEGVLPYNLENMFFKLTQAFKANDPEAVLRLSADFGHYIADAHVPLHTTTNYNGQLTNQVGIHAFWESRLPELYADTQYDFLVGQAEYISNKEDYFWDIVTESHRLLDSVLLIEKRLSETYPADQQYCYDERLGRTVRIECEAYARTYHDAMGNMVERRMQEAIKSVASLWYSAWVDAGQPNLGTWGETTFEDTKEFDRNNTLGGGAHDSRE